MFPVTSNSLMPPEKTMTKKLSKRFTTYSNEVKTVKMASVARF
jgi:hypothetical protein